MKITKVLGSDILLLDNGRANTLSYKLISTNPNTYISPEGHFDRIIEYADGTFERRGKYGEKWFFNTNGVLWWIEDRIGYDYIVFEYDGQGRILTIANTLGREITFAYYSDRWTITDFANRTWTYSYGAENDLHTVTDPNGLVTTYNYTSHNLISVTDANGQTWIENTYDVNDMVTTQRYGATGDNFRFAYYPDSNQAIVTDRRDVNTVTVYNSAGLPLSETTNTFDPKLRVGDPNSYSTRYEYDSIMNLNKQIMPGGNYVRYTYDTGQNGNILTATMEPNNGVDTAITTQFTYNATYNFVETITDAKDNITTFDYDSYGNLESIMYPEVNVVDANGAFNKRRPVVGFTYNFYGQVDTMTGTDGIITKYEYYETDSGDPNYGRTKKVIVDYNETGGLNITTEYKYDILGNVTEVNDPNGNITRFAYNVVGDINHITDPCSYVTNFFYDKNKKVSFIRRPIGDTNQVTAYGYDILDHVKEVTNPLGYVTNLSYDKSENRSDVNDAERNNTHSEYDERNLLWKVTDANGGVTTYGYTLNGDLNDISDAKGNKTRYEYDGHRRLKKVIYADDLNETFTYDSSSNVTSYTNRGGETIQYKYDALNRLIDKKRTWEPNIIFRYDIAGRLVDVNDGRSVSAGGGLTQYKYDVVGRVREVNDIFGRTVKYEYDKRGLRTKMVYPDDSNVTYEYDGLSRVKKIRYNGAVMASYSYDQIGRRTMLSYGNDTNIVYEYDIANQVRRVKNNISGGAAIDFNYANFDKVGNRLSMKVGSGNSKVYRYNKVYEVNYVDYNNGNETWYDYDKLGNRMKVIENTTETLYQANVLNEYTGVGAENYFYDSSGNLVCDGPHVYSYDCENRLRQSLLPIPGWNYYYDYLGRRVSKATYWTTMRFCYDGDQLIADYNGSDLLQRKYVYGPGIDEPVCMITAGGSIYYYHYDGLGSVVGLSNEAKEMVDEYSYDVFGQPSSTSSVGNRFMFTGREYDSETGLYYYRARYYSPKIGRFLSPDPIGYEGGLNIYTYVGNNPLNWIDPWGMCRKELDALENELAELIQNYIDMMSRFYDGLWRACNEYQEETIKWGLNTEHFALERELGNKTRLGFGPPVIVGPGTNTGEMFIVVYNCTTGEVILMFDPWTSAGPWPFHNWHMPWRAWIWGPGGEPLGPP